jgi:hypothetical protein
MVRSIFLRGFSYMDDHEVKFIRDSVTSNIEATEDGKRKVTWTNGTTKTTR